MGIIIRDEQSGEIVFYMKGADTVMNRIVLYNDWLEEECGNMAREGLRTLVVAKRALTEEQYAEFDSRYQAAKLALTDRTARVAAVVESLERDMELLAVTGVEDRLQVSAATGTKYEKVIVTHLFSGKCQTISRAATKCGNQNLDVDWR